MAASDLRSARVRWRLASRLATAAGRGEADAAGGGATWGNIGFPGEAAQPGQPDGIGVEIHVGAQRNDRIDSQVLFEVSHPLAINQSAVHDENFDKTFVHGPDYLFHQFIQDRALMPPAGNHARRHHKEEVQLAVDVNQAHQLVAAVLLISLVAEIHLVRFYRMVVFIEPKQIGLLVVLVIGDE